MAHESVKTFPIPYTLPTPISLLPNIINAAVEAFGHTNTPNDAGFPDLLEQLNRYFDALY